MGWRYEVIVLGLMTLSVFFLRYFVFRFHESPKFLLSKGKEAEAIEVLHKIAKFNKAAPPTLTIEMFAAIDASGVPRGPLTTTQTTKHVVRGFLNSFKHLKGLFVNKLQLFIFFLLAITYMVSVPLLLGSLWHLLTHFLHRRATIGHLIWLAHTSQSSCFRTTSPVVKPQ